MRISPSILREWRRRTIYRAPTEISSPWRLVSSSLVSRCLVVTPESHSDDQISTGEGQGASAVAKSPEKWNINPLTGKKRVGSNWSYSAELSALAHRIGIDAVHLPLLQAVLRDENQLDGSSRSQRSSLEEQQYENDNHLSVLGRSVMLHYVHEYLYFNYPKLTVRMLQDIRDFLNSDPVVTDMASHLGITQLIQTAKILGDPSNVNVIRTAFYAVIGLLYENHSAKAARSFVHDFIISQLASKDLGELINLQQPRFILQAVLKSKGRRGPVSRLIKESGRATHFPSFVVGVYSGAELLGEGCGTSLKRAEREAMLAALQTHFQTELSNVVLPSDDQEMIPEEQLLQWTAEEGQQEAENHQPNEQNIEIKATI